MDKRRIQCVSVDSASLIIYPEIKATEVAFSALKRYLCSFYFRIDNETGGIHRNTLYSGSVKLQFSMGLKIHDRSMLQLTDNLLYSYSYVHLFV